MLKNYKEKKPIISDSCFVAENASVIGDVKIGAQSSVWFGAVIRGDYDSITIGENCNVQDNCVLHTTDDLPIKIGDNVSVGHAAIVHGATIEDNVLVGMGAVILNGAKIGENSIIGAGAVCTENMVVPKGSVVVGIPGKVIKTAEEKNKVMTTSNASSYAELAQEYLKK